MKYGKKLRPNIKFQADRIFVRNDVFEQVIKSCKAANIEFLMFKDKLGIYLYEENYYEEEIIKIQNEEPIEEISKVSTKKSTKALIESQTMNQLMNRLMNQTISQLMNQITNQIKNQIKNQTMNQIKNQTIKIQQIGMIQINLIKY